MLSNKEKINDIFKLPIYYDKDKQKLLYVLSQTQATGGYSTLPSYRIPIVWENLFLKLRNAILDDSSTEFSVGNLDRKCKKSKQTSVA